MQDRHAGSVVLTVVPLAGAATVLVARPWDAGVAALVLFVVAALLEAFPVPLAPDVKSSLSAVAVLLGLLTGGLPLAVAASLGTAATLALRLTDRRLVKSAYNMGMFVLASAMAVVGFDLVAGAGASAGTDGLGAGAWLPGVAVALGAYYLTNLLLLAAAIWATGGPAPHRTVASLLVQGWWGQPVTFGFAAAAFVIQAEAGPVALLLLLVPLVSARRALAGVEAQRASLDRAVRALVRLVEVKDEYTRGHAERVAELAERVAARMGVPARERYWIRIGAILHDVGKIGVPLEVLTKPGELTAEEYWHMRRHPDVGADLLEHVDALAPAVALVRQHHERIDGCGYPRGLAGDDLPLATRIVSAVDSWDAMVTTRPYRRGLSPEVAVRELRLHAGSQFDARVVEQLIAEVAPAHVVRPVVGASTPAPAPAAQLVEPALPPITAVADVPS